MKKIILTIAVFISTLQLISQKIHKCSFYGKGFHGKKTASGEIFNKNTFTCASTKLYKLGTKLLVTNIKNGKSVIVRVTDRGNFAKYGRTLDLAEAAFRKLSSTKVGVINCTIQIV